MLGNPRKKPKFDLMKRNYRHVLLLLGLLSLLLIGPRSYAQEIRESEPLPPFTALNVEGPVKIEQKQICVNFKFHISSFAA